MKNLFFIPFAFNENKRSGVNIKNDFMNTYLKNLCVALISAKKATPNIDVALVCNIEIPKTYEQMLRENDVLIYIEPFDTFVFENNYLWCLAFYKLCALEKMLNHFDYDNYIYTDTDVFVQKPLDNIFLECRDNILLYDINHGLLVQDYNTLLKEFSAFGIDSYITHYGGEFFGASRENAKIFVTHCKDIYKEMISKNFITTKGDEFITSIAAYRMRQKIKNAGAYIFRFWTGDFYLVSTCFKHNEIAILHLPSEKQDAILKLFDIYTKKNAFPPNKKIHKMCHLNRKPLKYSLKSIVKRILRR